jgi:hypothetical protein
MKKTVAPKKKIVLSAETIKKLTLLNETLARVAGGATQSFCGPGCRGCGE